MEVKTNERGSEERKYEENKTTKKLYILFETKKTTKEKEDYS